MNEQTQYAPGIGAEDRIILFDGVCKLCSAWVRFLIRFDKRHQFKLASVQSPEGQAILQWHGFPTVTFESMLLVEGLDIYEKSSAFFWVLARLPWPWPILCVGQVVPLVVRDWLYDRIALNRYKLFGRYDACSVPEKKHQSRFLGGWD